MGNMVMAHRKPPLIFFNCISWVWCSGSPVTCGTAIASFLVFSTVLGATHRSQVLHVYHPEPGRGFANSRFSVSDKGMSTQGDERKRIGSTLSQTLPQHPPSPTLFFPLESPLGKRDALPQGLRPQAFIALLLPVLIFVTCRTENGEPHYWFEILGV